MPAPFCMIGRRAGSKPGNREVTCYVRSHRPIWCGDGWQAGGTTRPAASTTATGCPGMPSVALGRALVPVGTILVIVFISGFALLAAGALGSRSTDSPASCTGRSRPARWSAATVKRWPSRSSIWRTALPACRRSQRTTWWAWW